MQPSLCHVGGVVQLSMIEVAQVQAQPAAPRHAHTPERGAFPNVGAAP